MSESAGKAAWSPILRTAGLLITFALLGGAAFLLLAGAASALSETEPNNDFPSANAFASTGTYTVTGSTHNTTDPADYFRFNLTGPSVVEVMMVSTGTCTGIGCEILTVYAANGSVLVDPFGDPMNSNDVYFSGLAGSSWYVKVALRTAGTFYTVSVVVHPFTYTTNEHVDIVQANDSSAIVAFGDSDLKTSPSPYDLWTEGEGVYYGSALKLFVVNVGPYDLRIDLPAGLIFESEDAQYANFVVTRDQYVTVPAWTYRSVYFVAVSDSPFKWVPGDPSLANNDPAYFLGPMATGELARITAETSAGDWGAQAEQVAVWAWTAGLNRRDFENRGASTSAINDGIGILDAAGVHAGLNAKSGWTFPILSAFFDSAVLWILCFLFLFLGIPMIIGLSQAFRIIRLKNLQIDNTYGWQQTRERREDLRQRREEAKRMERDRRLQRRHEEEMARARSFPAPVPVVVAPPPPPAPSPSAAQLASFLAMDAEERFDLDRLNGLDYNAVLAEAMREKGSAAQAGAKAQAMLNRIRGDIADPDTIDDILRDRMVKWYRESRASAGWSEPATRLWSGLVAESSAAGGRRRAPLEKRLAALQQACDARGKWFKPKTPGEKKPKMRKGQTEVPPDPAVVKAQAVQAVLDDMAAAPRPDGISFSLPVLSELSAKWTTQRVNQAFAEMFKADVRGPYVVIHPSRYPDCDITVVRPPAAGARAGAVAYEVVFARAAAPAAGPQVAGGVPSGPGSMMLDLTGAIWDRPSVTKEEWAAVLGELQRSRQRMDPPPGAYRKLPPYFTLRELLISSDEARRAFLGVKWRGKPVGLPLLTQLLIDRSLTPEFDTDREYFEAELGDLERGDVNYQSPTGRWTIGSGLQVSRSGDAGTGISYKL